MSNLPPEEHQEPVTAPEPLTVDERLQKVEHKLSKSRMTRGFALSFLLFLIIFYAQSVQNRNDQVTVCERGNQTRQGQLDLANDLVEVNNRRIKAASSPAEARANRYARNQYRKDRNALIEAQKDVATEKGGVQVDCQKVYPLPWPANWFA